MKYLNVATAAELADELTARGYALGYDAALAQVKKMQPVAESAPLKITAGTIYDQACALRHTIGEHDTRRAMIDEIVVGLAQLLEEVS